MGSHETDVPRSGLGSEYKYSEVRPRDSRDGRPGPGFTSGTARAWGAGAAAARCVDARAMRREGREVVKSILSSLVGWLVGVGVVYLRT